jgi:DNA repair photolyase
MEVFQTSLKTGIRYTPEFEKKGLAQFAVNVGTKCGHDCLYCSTGSMMRMHRSFKQSGVSPFGNGYAIVDPDTPERVRASARNMRRRGLIQLCTIVDAWSPEAQKYNLGAACLEAILREPGWTVRILTKNAAVVKDFELIERFRDRVQVGISLTGTAPGTPLLSLLEPNASPIPERMAALTEANRRGLRTYAMLCPLLPGIANSSDEIRELVDFSLSHNAEEIFAEPINGRGPGLARVEDALRNTGWQSEADAVANVRKAAGWSPYVVRLLADLQSSLAARNSVTKLRFLLYPAQLVDKDRRWLRLHDQGVKWLEKTPSVL